MGRRFFVSEVLRVSHKGYKILLVRRATKGGRKLSGIKLGIIAAVLVVILLIVLVLPYVT